MSKTNVIQMTQPSEDDLMRTHVRAFACLRALDRVAMRMRAENKAKAAEWRAKLEAAEQKYEGPIRAEFDDVDDVDLDATGKGAKATMVRYATLGRSAVIDMREHSRLEAKAKQDKEARDGKVKMVEQAMRECFAAVSDVDSRQESLPWQTARTGIDGMQWATKGTMELAYAALYELDRGAGLDAFQADLLVDLGSAGLDAVDLGMNASEAIARDVQVDDEDEDVAEVSDDELGW